MWVQHRQDISALGNVQMSLLQQTPQAISSSEVVTGILNQLAGLADMGGALETRVEGLDLEESNIKAELVAIREELTRQNH